MKTKFSLLLLGAGLALAPLSSAQAQPDLNAAPKGQNPQNWGNNNRIILNGRPLTPEQIKQMQVLAQERKAISMRQQLTQAGFTDTTLQDAIIAFSKDKEAAREKLQTQWQAVNAAGNTPNTTDAQLAAQLNDFQAAADQEKDRRAKAFKDLSTKIGLADKPRLQLLLITMGLVDDDTALLQQGNTGNSIFRLNPLNLLGGDALNGFGNLGGLLPDGNTPPLNLFNFNRGQDLDLRRYIPLYGKGFNGRGLDTRVKTPIGPVHLDIGVGHD